MENTSNESSIIITVLLASFLVRRFFFNIIVSLVSLSGRWSPKSVTHFGLTRSQELREARLERRREIPTNIWIYAASTGDFTQAIGRSSGGRLTGIIRATYDPDAIVGRRETWNLHVYNLLTGELINPSRYIVHHVDLADPRFPANFTDRIHNDARNIVPLDPAR